MTTTEQRIKVEFMELLRCPICINAFTDPRMLPCIHTFCFECLNSTAEANHSKPEDKMACPLCRKDFTIPADGVNGVPKNFFMESLLQFKTTLQMESLPVICDICNAKDESKTGQIPMATMRCIYCRYNYCDSCSKVHQLHRLSKDHKVEQIIFENETSPMTQYVAVRYCTKHHRKQLEYFCSDCKKIVCVSCFVESHSSHRCQDVTTLDTEFRQRIEKEESKISVLKDEMSSMRNDQEKRKSDFLNEIDQKEKEILGRNQELKRLIDQHTQWLVNELSAIKSNHLKEMENQMEEIDRCCTILRSFEAYCTEMRLKGSAVDICSSVDHLIVRADELERDHKAFIDRPNQTIELSFQATNFSHVLQNSNGNLVGNVQGRFESGTLSENFAVVTREPNKVFKVNLLRPNDISLVEKIPSKISIHAVTSVSCNSMYVTGVGENSDEMWKYNDVSGWVKCASLFERRYCHSQAFFEEVLYICGGCYAAVLDDFGADVDSVEAYDSITDEAKVVGSLLHDVVSLGSCVPVKSSLYIFGGSYYSEFHHVQVYNTSENQCSVLSRPMPRRCFEMPAVHWDKSIILLGTDSCFIFNIETESWQERKRFKTDIHNFGLILENEKVFVIGGGISRKEVLFIPIWNILNDKPIEWKTHATLPENLDAGDFVKMRLVV